MDGVDPPCETCPRGPTDETLWAENGPAWRLWTRAHRWGRDGMSGELRIEAVLALARLTGATERDVERALWLEEQLTPRLRRKA